MKIRLPWSRQLCTHPASVTVSPACDNRKSPQLCVFSIFVTSHQWKLLCGRLKQNNRNPAATGYAMQLSIARPTLPWLASVTPTVSERHILVKDFEETGDDSFTAQGRPEVAVDVDGRPGFLAGTRQRDAYVRVFRFTRPVYDAAHHGDLQILHTRVPNLPGRHLAPDIVLDLIGHLLEQRRGSAAAPRTR